MSVLFLGITSQCLAQWTPWGLGLMQRPNAYTGRIYLGITNVVAGTNIVIYYSPSLGSLVVNATGSGGGGGSGTVTSFSSGNLSPLFTTAVATATTTPALSFSLTSQSANTVFSGPTGGGAAAPSFRALVANDIPSLTLSKISDAGTVAAINLSGNASEFLNGVGGWSAGTSSGVSGVTNSGGTHSLISVSNTPTIGLKSISSGSNITITNQGTNLLISSTASGGGTVASYRYYRIYVNAVGSSPTPDWGGIQEVRLKETIGGTNVASGKTWILSGGSGGNQVSDGSFADGNGWIFANGSTLVPQWCYVDLGTNRSIAYYDVGSYPWGPGTTYQARASRAWFFQGSSGTSNWITLHTVSDQLNWTWTEMRTNMFVMPMVP